MLKVKVISCLSSPLKDSLEQFHIVRMDPLQNQIGCRLRPGRVPIDPSRFLGPKHPLGTCFHSGTTGVTESLRICQMRFAPAKFRFGALPFVDIEIGPNPK
jgi:hypothetical protein